MYLPHPGFCVHECWSNRDCLWWDYIWHCSGSSCLPWFASKQYELLQITKKSTVPSNMIPKFVLLLEDTPEVFFGSHCTLISHSSSLYRQEVRCVITFDNDITERLRIRSAICLPFQSVFPSHCHKRDQTGCLIVGVFCVLLTALYFAI